MSWFENLDKVLDIQRKDRVRRESENLSWLYEHGWKDTVLSEDLTGLMQKTLADGRVVIAPRNLALAIEDALQAGERIALNV